MLKPGSRRFLWLWPLFLVMYNYHYSHYGDNNSLSMLDPAFHHYHRVHGNHSQAVELDFYKEQGKVGRRLLYGDSNYTVIGGDCVPSSIDDFPGDFFNQEQRRKGGVLIHFILIAYICTMLGMACDRYFVPSLEVISEYTRISPDVAGATFMAIGTSAPELFSSIIGSFITESDVGIGTIIGSAVFNILAVTGISGIALGTKCVPLQWYPFTRDIVVYVFSIVALITIVSNNQVTWWESTILLGLFVIYLLLLCFNKKIEPTMVNKMARLKKWLTSSKNVPTEDLTVSERTPLLYNKPPSIVCNGSCLPSNTKDSSIKIEKCDSLGPSSCVEIDRVDSCPQIVSSLKDSQMASKAAEENEDEMEYEKHLCLFPWKWSPWNIFWLLMWPANFVFYITVPDCRKKKYKKLFFLTFLISVVWIGLLSYLAFWMVTIVGYTLNIPDTVSGLTILAAGISIPEVISSIIVVKNGQGNMALSNLIGSNVFDILFCLGVPWLIKTSFFSDSKPIAINSSALPYTTIALMSTILFLFFTLVVARWELNWKVGVVCLLLYFAFLIVASLYESNVFGEFNPPMCYS